ncbi:MAG: ATP-binding protein [Polyangiaceae bacterium]|nr:ATP-binding protein [Polyangiaceae bacterium]MCW5790155.1 ATP-binding protein [Polyangiaceae bacterium]
MTRFAAPRTLHATLVRAATQYPVVTLTGPRQSGKTTLCRMAFPEHAYVSLEPLDTREFAAQDPRGFLAQFAGGVILDEAQRAPALFSYLQETVDRDPRKGRFIVSGSENLTLAGAVSQSLAGRTAMLVLLPFSLEERAVLPSRPNLLDEALFTGGYPRPLVEGIPHERWLQDYFTTYVQRDVRQLARIGDLDTFSRFVRACAGRTAQELNLSQLGGDVGVSHNTARAWLGVLEASYLVFRIPAWHRNIKKQIIKQPKLHFCDTGLACALLGIRHHEQLATHPLRGAIFESFVASELRKWHLHRGHPADLHHYRESRGSEVDLLIPGHPRGQLIECKSGQTMQAEFLRHLESFSDEQWEKRLVYGGEQPQTRGGVKIVPWSAMADAGCFGASS